LLSLALLIALTSCDNINTDTVPIEDLNTVASTSRLRFVSTRDYDTSGMEKWEELSTVPAAILEYITNNHPDEVVEEAWLTNTGEYIVLLDDETVLLFNSSEQFIISFNLEAYTGSFEDDKEYYIELSNEIVLIFNVDGSFVREYTEEDDDDE
jgi:hypothetical protein